MVPEDNPADDDPHHECRHEIERLLREVWRLDAELNGEHGQRAQRYEAELDNQRLRAELMIVTADRDTLLRTFAKPMAALGDSVRSPSTAPRKSPVS